MPEHVATTDPEGVDFGWVMQVTFVLTVLVGAPTVALLSTQVALPDWGSRVAFAIRVGAPVWVVTGLCVYLYARRQDGADEEDQTNEVEATAESQATRE